MDRIEPPADLTRVSTGVHELDIVMGGGVPEHSTTVLAGDPGTGKTILAMQMLFQQARAGKRCIYFTTLSEPSLKIIRYMRLFGFFDEDLVGRSVSFVDLGTVLMSEGGMGAVAAIEARLESVQPDFVVIDSFKAIHDVIESGPAGSRRVAYEISVLLAAWGATTLLLGEYTERERAGLPEFAIADGIIQVWNQPYGLTRLRALEIEKLRGVEYIPGRHFFEISDSGLTFYPRLRGVRGQSSEVWTPAKVPTGLTGLDELLRGGLPSGSTTLLEGGTGSGKSSLAMKFLVEGARRGEPGLHFGLEERPVQLRGVTLGFGWDLADFEARGLLRLQYTSPVELNADQFVAEAIGAIRSTRARRVVFDSSTSLALGLEIGGRYRELIYALATHLREEGITAIITAETPRLFGNTQLTGAAVSSIVDNVILLRYVEVDNRLEHAISVLKVRGFEHGTELRRMTFGSDGPTVGPPFTGLQGVLTGSPHD
ncbi:MAG: recombinase RecA [Dehalococcoidia bacterium]|nr:MAG: recombinase RecA [Dehalococcoidia bacterium]